MSVATLQSGDVASQGLLTPSTYTFQHDDSVRVVNMEQSSDCKSPTVDFGFDFDLLLRRCLSDTRERRSAVASEHDVIVGDDVHNRREGNGELELKAEKVRNPDAVDNVENATNVDQADESEVRECDNDNCTTKTPEETTEGSDIPETGSPTTHGQSANSITKPKESNRKAQKRKRQHDNKKWKVITTDFEIVLIPRRTPVEEEVTVEMEEELRAFEEGSQEKEGKEETEGKEEKEEKEKKEGKQEGNDPATCPLTAEKEDSEAPPSTSAGHERTDGHMGVNDQDWFDGPCITDLEAKLSARDAAVADRFFGLSAPKRLRDKHKWRRVKARKVLSVKFCRQKKVYPHGALLYRHHRLCHPSPIPGFPHVAPADARSLRMIDKERHVDVETFKDILKGRSGTDAMNTSAARSKRGQGRDRHANLVLNNTNADGALTPDLINMLMGIEDRELTPEDYDLLLRLDDRVAPKTLDVSVIAKLKVTPVTTDVAGDTCAICQDDYVIGEQMKALPCGHVFHVYCVDNWLQNSSVTCPLDGSEVIAL